MVPWLLYVCTSSQALLSLSRFRSETRLLWLVDQSNWDFEGLVFSSQKEQFYSILFYVLNKMKARSFVCKHRLFLIKVSIETLILIWLWFSPIQIMTLNDTIYNGLLFHFHSLFLFFFFWGAKTTIINRITSERIENERFSIFGWQFVNLRNAIDEAHIYPRIPYRPGDLGSAIQSLRVVECYRHSMISG